MTNTLNLSHSITKENYIEVIPQYAEIEVEPEGRVDFGVVYLGSESDVEQIKIKNIGNKDLIIEQLTHFIDNTPFTYGEIELPLSIPADETYSLDVVFTPKVAGTINDSLYVHSNAKENPIYAIGLRGRGEYVPPKPPTNVQSVMDGYDMVISWDEVTETIFDTPIEPDAYLAFYNGNQNVYGEYYFHGLTTDLTYTHYFVGRHAKHMFYRVVAYKYFGSERFDIESLGLKEGMPESEVKDILRKADYGVLGTQELRTSTK